MKRAFLSLLLTLLTLSSCKDTGSQQGNAKSVQNQNDAPAEDASRSEADQLSPKSLAPDVIASVVRVRVLDGESSRNHTGALVHQDEIPTRALKKAEARIVLAMLPGYTETQLLAPKARVLVYRNKVDDRGNQEARKFSGQVLRYEPSSGLALLSYTDTFSYDQDVGFRIARNVLPDTKGDVLATTGELSDTTDFQQGGIPPFPVARKVYVVDQGGAVKLKSGSEIEKESDIAPLAVAASDKLLGFVSGESGGIAKVISAADFSLAVPIPTIEPKSVAFSNHRRHPNLQDSDVFIEVAVDIPPRQRSSAWNVQLNVKECPEGSLDTMLQRYEDGSYEPIVAEHDLQGRQHGVGSVKLAKKLLAPETEGEARHFLVQLSWWNDQLGSSSRTYGKPLKVTITRREGGFHPKVEGAQVAGMDAEKTSIPEEKFRLESPARNIHPICEGREILFELEGAPFWKRFSLEKKQWLTLPGGDLGNVRITGNRDALFVIDRQTGEIRKYALADLKLQLSAKLPAGKDYVAVLAGGNTARGPVHVLHTDGSFAVSPRDLRDLEIPSGKDSYSARSGQFFAHGDWFSVFGDGMSFVSHKGLFEYRGDSKGLICHRVPVFEPEDFTEFIAPAGITTSYLPGGKWIGAVNISVLSDFKRERDEEAFKSVSSRLLSTCGAANAPVSFRLYGGDKSQVPPIPARLECVSLFDSSPFVEIEVPEFNDVTQFSGKELNRCRWAVLEPYSLSLGTLDQKRTTFTVRKLPPVAEDRQPILLNWPDTSLTRGEGFRFEPLIVGRNKTFSAEITGKPGALSVDTSVGTITGQTSQDEIASLQMMTLSIPGKDGGNELKYLIPLHVAGVRPPMAILPQADSSEANRMGQTFESLTTNRVNVKPLVSALYIPREPIVDVVGPVAGHLALVGASDRVDFYSLQSKTVSASIAKVPTASYYGGAEALFEYDSAKKSLTRISVPDGKRGHVLNLPAHVTPLGIGIGADRTSPVTLVVQITKAPRPTGQNFGQPTVERAAFVLENNTLQTVGWKQPVVSQSPAQAAERNRFTDPLYFSTLDKTLVQLPVSQNGRVVILPNAFLLLGGQVSLVQPYDTVPSQEKTRERLNLFAGGPKMRGSMSGLLAFTANASAYRAGSVLPTTTGRSNFVARAFGVSGCGRYRLSGKGSIGNEWSDYVEVRTLDTDRVLLQIGGLTTLVNEMDSGQASTPNRIISIGDGGSFALLSHSGRAMQVVDVNVPELTREMSPEEVHVISQPQFYVPEGGTVDYQVQVNNPTAVQSIQLLSKVPGANISPSGLFRFTAPPGAKGGSKVDISIELLGKDGQKAVQEFPVYIFSIPKPGAQAVAAPR